MNENKVILKILGFAGSLPELSKRLQLEPTKTALKGEDCSIGPAHQRVKRTYEWNYWEYRWTRTEERYIADMVEEFIASIVEPRKETLKELIAGCRAELSLVQYYYGCNPGFHFSQNALRTISYIGAEIDVDIYCFDEDEQENA